MRGSVLGYDAGAGVSVVRGEDGQRYAFAPPAWREQRPPRKGDLVDFEPNGGRAEMVFLLTPPKDAGKTAPEAPPPLAIASRIPLLKALLDRPVLIVGVLLLLAGFTGVYRFGTAEVSLYAVPDLISGFAGALDAMVGASGVDPHPRLVAAVLRFVLPLMLLLYLVPLLVARAVWREFCGRPAGGWGRWGGIAAMALPIVLPLLVIVPAHLALLPSVEGTTIRLSSGGVEVPRQAFDVLRFYGTGTVLLFLSGLALWASASGRFLAARSESREGAGSGTGTVLRGGPASFGPPSVRQDQAAEEHAEMVLPAALQRRQQSARMVREQDEDDEAAPQPDEAGDAEERKPRSKGPAAAAARWLSARRRKEPRAEPAPRRERPAAEETPAEAPPPRRADREAPVARPAPRAAERQPAPEPAPARRPARAPAPAPEPEPPAWEAELAEDFRLEHMEPDYLEPSEEEGFETGADDRREPEPEPTTTSGSCASRPRRTRRRCRIPTSRRFGWGDPSPSPNASRSPNPSPSRSPSPSPSPWRRRGAATGGASRRISRIRCCAATSPARSGRTEAGGAGGGRPARAARAGAARRDGRAPRCRPAGAAAPPAAAAGEAGRGAAPAPPG